MKSFVLASLVATALSQHVPNKAMLFKGFMEKYKRKYDSEFEKGRRFQIFGENVDQIYDSNSKNKTYKLGITENADLTFEEWRATHLNGFKPVLTAERKNAPTFHAPEAFTPPDSIDWTKKGGVTEVKNQGTCGSCWTFSAVGALEGAMAVSGRKMVDLSMQQILACDTGGNGCNGGTMPQAFNWVMANGIAALADVPYLCKDASSSACQNMEQQCPFCQYLTGEDCKHNTSCSKVAGSVCNKGPGRQWAPGYCECTGNLCFADGKCGPAPKGPASLVLAPGDVVSETNVDQTANALEAAVAQQPVSVAIEADQPVFQHYKSGVLTNDACGSNFDHGVLAVGYGEDNGQKYWKVKNSWGTTFGEDGYIRIEKGAAEDGGECGIRKMASFPVLKKASTIVV